MTLLQVILLAILQGTTEFLPISSSGHLVIVPHLLGWPDPGLTLDLTLHLGTTFAILLYFWRDLLQLAVAMWDTLRKRSAETPSERLAWSLVIGTLPAMVIGLLFDDAVEALFGMPRAAAAFLLVTAVLLATSEWIGRRERTIESIGWKDGLLIGLAQTIAVAPGLSRSGATISAGLYLGFKRKDAAHFSFLLAVPVVALGGFYKIAKSILIHGVTITDLGMMFVGFVVSMLVGYISIAGLLALIRKVGLWPFAIYCALLGTLVLTGVLA